ncbi:hypothetical protein [Streptomyces sp. IBSBF 2390]|uniref:hypothetical protein n=1 Tax=Streptomyces sp. IBSBF 2390 TaxID=2903533 RepID=UPI002FDC272F
MAVAKEIRARCAGGTRIAGISCIAALAAGTIGVASAEAAPTVHHQAASDSTSHDGNTQEGAQGDGQGNTQGEPPTP